MIVQVQSGIETRPRWATGARLGVVAPKEHTFARERVKVGGVQTRVAERRQAIAAPLVSGDEKNVAGGGGHTVTDLLDQGAIAVRSIAVCATAFWVHQSPSSSSLTESVHDRKKKNHDRGPNSVERQKARNR